MLPHLNTLPYLAGLHCQGEGSLGLQFDTWRLSHEQSVLVGESLTVVVHLEGVMLMMTRCRRDCSQYSVLSEPETSALTSREISTVCPWD